MSCKHARSVTSQFLSIALFIYGFFQDATAVEERVRALQSRVSNLMIIIVDKVTVTNGNTTKTTITKAAKEMEKDIADLKGWVVVIMS